MFSGRELFSGQEPFSDGEPLQSQTFQSSLQVRWLPWSAGCPQRIQCLYLFDVPILGELCLPLFHELSLSIGEV